MKRPLVLLTRLAAFGLGAAQAVAADLPVSVTIDPAAGKQAISPYIYGSNQDFNGVPLTARRIGGNRLTAYNWENNASNAGSDYLYQSDDYLTWVSNITGAAANVPGATLTHFMDQSVEAGVPYSVVTLQMAGYVAKDKAGPVLTAEAPPSARWVKVQNAKGTALALAPDTTDGAVYTDELLNFLISRYGKADTAHGIRGYDLDNEPALWSSTHAELHPAQPTCVELLTKSIDLAGTIKRMDPAAEVFGPVSYGFGSDLDFQGAPDWIAEKARGGGRYRWFLDYYLDQMKQASASAGTRLLDVLDLHLYTEAIAGGVRVNTTTDYTNIAANQGRMQAPRELWDPAYVQNSWIGQYYSSFLPFLPNIRQSITGFYPGTKLAFTEYAYGGDGHISGGIAEADALGIFGKNGVYLATLWPGGGNTSYLAAALNLYRNYDGGGAKFGDTAVAVTNNDIVTTSAYAAVESGDATRLHVILLNKSYDNNAAVAFDLGTATTYRSGRVYAFDATSAIITERSVLPAITGNKFTYLVPPLTAAHLVLSTAAATTPPPDTGSSGSTTTGGTGTSTGTTGGTSGPAPKSGGGGGGGAIDGWFVAALALLLFSRRRS